MKKVCIVVTSLNYGGAEKVSVLLSDMITDMGFEVTLLSITDRIDLKVKCRLVTLPKLRKNKGFDPLKLGKTKAMVAFMNSEQFDLIIDSRSRPSFIKEIAFQHLVFRRTPKISMVHSANLNTYFAKYTWQNHFLYGNQTTFVGVSKGVVDLIQTKFGFTNVKCIHNSFDPKKMIIEDEENQYQIPEGKFVIFFGRIEERSKNLRFLIDQYVQSSLPEKGVKLLILGSGPDLEAIRMHAQSKKDASSISFKDFVPHPLVYVKKALFTIMTSNYEGFPMTMVESLAIGIPVVSLDFDHGPAELIQHEQNGLLVPLKERSNFYEYLNRMIEDETLYTKCKDGALPSVAHLKQTNITNQWKELIQSKLL